MATFSVLRKNDNAYSKFHESLLICFLDSVTWNFIIHNLEPDFLAFNDFGPPLPSFMSVLEWQPVAIIKIYYKNILKNYLAVYANEPTECKLQKTSRSNSQGTVKTGSVRINNCRSSKMLFLNLYIVQIFESKVKSNHWAGEFKTATPLWFY